MDVLDFNLKRSGYGLYVYLTKYEEISLYTVVSLLLITLISKQKLTSFHSSSF
jgi:hypothetical protein